MKNKTYNGWLNWETWNVAMHLNLGLTDYYVKNIKSFKNIRSYRGFIKALGLEQATTLDGVGYLNSKLDFKALSVILLDCQSK